MLGELLLEPCWVCGECIIAFRSNEVIIWGCSLSLCDIGTAGNWPVCTHALAYVLFVPSAYLYRVAYLICIPQSQRSSCLRLGNQCILRASLLPNRCRYKANLEAGVPRDSIGRLLKGPRSWDWEDLGAGSQDTNPFLTFVVFLCEELQASLPLALVFSSIK